VYQFSPVVCTIREEYQLIRACPSEPFAFLFSFHQDFYDLPFQLRVNFRDDSGLYRFQRG